MEIRDRFKEQYGIAFNEWLTKNSTPIKSWKNTITENNLRKVLENPFMRDKIQVMIKEIQNKR